MWPVAIAVKTWSSMMNCPQTCALNSRIEKSSIFCLFCLLTNAAFCGIIMVGFNGPGTTVKARISDRTPHMENSWDF
jgi:hypothetical protein